MTSSSTRPDKPTDPVGDAIGYVAPDLVHEGLIAWKRVLDALEQVKTATRKFGPSQDILAFGDRCDAIHLLLSGWAYVFRPLEDGQQIILQFADRGTVIGFHPEPNAIAKYGCRTLSHSTVVVVTHEKLEELFKHSPTVIMHLTTLLSRDRNLAFDTIASFGRNSGRQRIARLLLQFAQRSYGLAQRADARELSIPLTQEHIADATGLSTGHVNRTLGALRRLGVVEFQYRKLRIIDLAKLVAEAGMAGSLPTFCALIMMSV